MEKILSDCRPDWAFWTCTGAIIRNLNELKNTLQGLNDGGFAYHVNKDKDDFAKWVAEAIGDEKLAHSLHGVLDKDAYVDIITKRLAGLNKKAEKAMRKKHGS
ncbi:MAG: hypothetical protein V1735_04005 [Nanoarchaeota archaeon]